MKGKWLAAIGAAFMLTNTMTNVAQAADAADTYPSKAVTMIVPYPAGGATDVVARAIAAKLGEVWHQSVIVENRAGAGTTIGANYVAHAPDAARICWPTLSYKKPIWEFES